MSAFKVHEGELHFITTTVVEWVDAFTRREYCEIILDAFAHCKQEKGLRLHAFVIMSNHIHLIASTDGKSSLSDIMRDFKQYTSRSIVQAIKSIPESRREWLLELFGRAADNHQKVKYYKFWQDGFHPIVLTSVPFIEQKLNYIHQNPVKAGIVVQAEAYMWSSAANYAGLKGVTEVELLF